MGFLGSIFGKKPTEKEIAAYNYYLFFDYIPKRMHEWEHNQGTLQSALTYSSLAEKNKVWKSLINETEITDSTLKKCNDVTLYLIKSPSNKIMGEVAMAIIAVNPKIRKFEYYTMEYSLGGFAICTADKDSNHYYMEECNDGEQFGVYVIKTAMGSLVPAPKPKPKLMPQAASSAPFPKQHTAESFLKTLEKIADQYYKEHSFVSLKDWMVTKKVGDTFKFYITQYPDAEFEDPNCEVTLMVDFMDHNGRMKVVNKFFPKKIESSSTTAKSAPSEISNIIGKHYTLDNIRQIQMGSVRLQPIDFGLIFNDQALQVIQIFAEQSPRIKKFLPNLNLSSVDDMRKYFANICKKTELGYEFGYAIKMNSAGDNGVIGFIFVHTPSENQYAIGFPEWTIDFCLFEPLEGKGIMRTSILRVLNVLKYDNHVSDVYAIVDEHNSKCIKLLSHLPFDCQKDILVDHATGNRANLFKCDLTKINFQHR